MKFLLTLSTLILTFNISLAQAADCNPSAEKLAQMKATKIVKLAEKCENVVFNDNDEGPRWTDNGGIRIGKCRFTGFVGGDILRFNYHGRLLLDEQELGRGIKSGKEDSLTPVAELFQRMALSGECEE